MSQPSEYKIVVALLVLQSLCAAFFLWDGAVDIVMGPTYVGWADPESFEFLVALALVASIFFTVYRFRQLRSRQKKMAEQLQIASGLFSKLIASFFEEWGLSEAESDVALMAIKGLSIADIANVRQSREGTVKAQLNAVYRKAGVTGRPQLLSLFIEELMNDGLDGSPNLGD